MSSIRPARHARWSQQAHHASGRTPLSSCVARSPLPTLTGAVQRGGASRTPREPKHRLLSSSGRRCQLRRTSRSPARGPARSASGSPAGRARAPVCASILSPELDMSGTSTTSSPVAKGPGSAQAPPSVAVMDAKVWSIYGAERAQPMATARKWDGRDGKEGVDGSSPSEGFAVQPASSAFLLSALTLV